MAPIILLAFLVFTMMPTKNQAKSRLIFVPYEEPW